MIDSHCHLNFESLAKNIDKIIYNSKKNNITSLLSINTNPKDFENHISLIKNHKGIYGSASKKQIRDLQDEGIETQTFPWIEDKNN